MGLCVHAVSHLIPSFVPSFPSLFQCGFLASYFTYRFMLFTLLLNLSRIWPARGSLCFLYFPGQALPSATSRRDSGSSYCLRKRLRSQNFDAKGVHARRRRPPPLLPGPLGRQNQRLCVYPHFIYPSPTSLLTFPLTPRLPPVPPFQSNSAGSVLVLILGRGAS